MFQFFDCTVIVEKQHQQNYVAVYSIFIFYGYLLIYCLGITVFVLNVVQGLGVAVTTAISLVTWQFSQFVLATQVAALLTLFALGVIKKDLLLLVLLFLAVSYDDENL